MKCPVCKNELNENALVCSNCNFTDLAQEFISIADAKYWEQTVVLPYRMAWKTGCLHEKAEWIYRELKWHVIYEAYEKERKTKIILNRRDDLYVDVPERIRTIIIKDYPDDIDEIISIFSKFNNLEEVWFSPTYGKGQELSSKVINKLLEICPKIVTLHISKGVDWSVISQINMEKIRRLYVSVKEAVFPMTLKAKNLKELIVTGTNMDDEYVKQKKSIDFKGVPLLEYLEFRSFSGLDFCSLSVLSNLKKLIVSDGGVADLLWMSSEYKLEELQISGGKITSLKGLERQTDLKVLDLGYNAIKDLQGLEKLKDLRRLCLRFNQVMDASVVSNLSQLEYLDLFKNNITDENNLRLLGIPTIILTKIDQDILRIKEFFDGNMYSSISADAYRWIKSRDTSDIDKMSPYEKRTHERWLSTPYSEKLKIGIQVFFEKNYKYYFYDILPSRRFDNSLKSKYIEKALECYPFLVLTETMRSDKE